MKYRQRHTSAISEVCVVNPNPINQKFSNLKISPTSSVVTDPLYEQPQRVKSSSEDEESQRLGNVIAHVRGNLIASPPRAISEDSSRQMFGEKKHGDQIKGNNLQKRMIDGSIISQLKNEFFR
jgi:hypothetical protein